MIQRYCILLLHATEKIFIVRTSADVSAAQVENLLDILTDLHVIEETFLESSPDASALQESEGMWHNRT